METTVPIQDVKFGAIAVRRDAAGRLYLRASAYYGSVELPIGPEQRDQLAALLEKPTATP